MRPVGVRMGYALHQAGNRSNSIHGFGAGQSQWKPRLTRLRFADLGELVFISQSSTSRPARHMFGEWLYLTGESSG